MLNINLSLKLMRDSTTFNLIQPSPVTFAYQQLNIIIISGTSDLKKKTKLET